MQEDFASLLQRAVVLEAHGKRDEAVALYRAAESLLPGHASPFTRLSVIAARRAWGFPPRPRPALPHAQARVSMSTLGHSGRFANQILQYGYLRLYAERCRCEVETGDWIGRDLFGFDDPPIARALPVLEEHAYDAAGAIAPDARPRSNVDLRGFYAFPSGHYGHSKARWQSLFQFQGPAATALRSGWAKAIAPNRTVIAMHLRRGDFGYGRFWIAPVDWYHRWLESTWPKWRDPLLYVATDDPALIREFDRYEPVHAGMFDGIPEDLEYVLDFHALCRAQVLATSNSTFSFVAAMLNQEARAFFRPDPVERRLCPFDPWASPVLLDPPYMRKEAGPVTRQESYVVRTLIGVDATVFDVGANRGEWSRLVQTHCLGRAHIHAFEPNPLAFNALTAWAETTRPGSTVVTQAAVAGAEGSREFQLYEWQDELSGFYKRSDPMFVGKPAPKSIPVRCVAIDDYCRERGIRHIDFLKVDVEGAELDVLRGCGRLLSHARIDYLQFEYGGTYRDSGARLHDVFVYLQAFGYRIFRMEGKLREVSEWHDSLENYQYSNFLAVHSRLTPYFGIGERKSPDLAAIVAAQGIQVRGVVHVGAHHGEEIDLYRKLGAVRMVMVEANPDVYAELLAKHGGIGDVVLVNRAASDSSELRKFHLTSSSQSGSLLRLGKHAEIYPQIVASGEIEVQCTPLDDIMLEWGQAGHEYNVLNIDVQGAELMVLRGAERTLRHVDLINVEVSFAELYTGCPQIDDIDGFLAERGFRRIALACPYHPTWGDAVYVKTRST